MSSTILSLLSVRLGRLGRHFLKIRQFFILQWLWETLVLVLEILFVGEFYVLLNRVLKPNLRRLTPREEAVARTVFGEKIDYSRVLIDTKARIGCKKGKFAYVSFYLINSWGEMTDSHLIHELAHIWQYERIGARYMPRAIQAQRSRNGYNYGGMERLHYYANEGFKAFNMEQQADIITDYFLVKNGRQAHWSYASKGDLEIYERYIALL